ncbi:unnamed protein product [Tilletia controversa]|uniref:Yos1-like protein n=3 Tax=Tilletia TaxID=13289 RepID=A0A8X7SSU2_9BASI|nr:hypothetical protein CF336_g8375 [Tilletia laevis]KAE8183878.1 hypothetical protein CF328_g8044 [Tilletia controversa]KAE8239077.1 hypothetical protein A4X03_0g8710 [Tilletia caries]KAE8184165.1 hypothetical protein CF335_g8105 [Tilletia laevis]KAE8238395.1 hypothetical protein A4X06_0g8790 [Tilletia controversa]
MVLGLGTLSLALLLLTNAVAILNEERFLARIGWSQSQIQHQIQIQIQMQDHQGAYGSGPIGGPGEPGIKARLVNLISAVRMLMRLPLIVINIVVILYLLILG